MMDDKLKPCPFCGGEAKINCHSFWNDKDKDFTDTTYGVSCKICNSAIPQFYGTRKEATDVWNSRASEDSEQGKKDAIVCAHWEYEDEPDYDGNITAHCSHCGAEDTHSAHLKNKIPYCWRCGTKMKED